MNATTHPSAISQQSTSLSINAITLVRGELRKLVHLRLTWILAGGITLFIVFAQLLLIAGSQGPAQIRSDPLGFWYQLMVGDLSIVRIFDGVAALFLIAHLIGNEYQYGTLRILLGHGVGRLRLLAAKVLAALAVLLVMALGQIIIEFLFGWGIAVTLGGSTHASHALNTVFWENTASYLLCVAISLVVTLLLGAAATVVGRSLAFGLTGGIGWFAVDNLLGTPLVLLARITHNDFWLQLSGILLGPILNRLPDEIIPPYQVTSGGMTISTPVQGFGSLPLVAVPGSHALLVIGIYAALFGFIAVFLTWQRDVLE
jgi:ABC-2 type transport system permease protein